MASDEPETTRQSGGRGGLVNRTWDPATGQWLEEDIPDDIQDMLRPQKKAKVTRPGDNNQAAWGAAGGRKVLGPAAAGLSVKGAAPAAQIRSAGPAGEVDRNTPSVEYRGFSKVDLDNRYYERKNVAIHGRSTYWSADGQFFIYWQGEVQRWSICDASSFAAVKGGQLPGWAYKEDHKPLCQASGWMEAWNGEWRQPDLEVQFRSASHHQPCWEDVVAQRAISSIEFRGFTMKELNTTYHLKTSETIQGKPSYWDKSGVYFIYWQQSTSRWAVCDLKCLEAVRSGQCPGWAYRGDSAHFANACGWQEMKMNKWVDANIETIVINTSSRGLKVQLHGFSRPEFNTTFKERMDEDVQGKPTYWDPSGTYFLYWQDSMKRWAILDNVSLHLAKSGLAPGWAYRTNSEHFSRANGWMEVWGKDWKEVRVKCQIVEGNVREAMAMKVKSELKEESGGGTGLSAQQYKALVKKVYELKNPSKLQELKGIYEKYAGREGELFSQVCEKYGADPDHMCTLLPQLRKHGAQVPAFKSVASAPQGDGDAYAHLEDAEVPEMKAAEYAVLVQGVYERHNPKKLMDMARLLQKYRSKERDLYLEVCTKYGEHPAKFHARFHDHAGAEDQMAEPA